MKPKPSLRPIAWDVFKRLLKAGVFLGLMAMSIFAFRVGENRVGISYFLLATLSVMLSVGWKELTNSPRFMAYYEPFVSSLKARAIKKIKKVA